jgi:cobalamin biosynthesis Mg chelatase CobN
MFFPENGLLHRDSFQNVVELLDDLFRRAGQADEADEDNFVRKHARAMRKDKVEAPTARLFSNPAGDYGSMVNERVGASNWTDSRARPLLLLLLPSHPQMLLDCSMRLRARSVGTVFRFVS